MKSSARHIAQRYVQALFDVATSARALEAVEKDLQALGHALEESQNFRHFLTNPLLTRAAQAKIAESLLDKMRAGDTTKQFLALLARHRRLAILPEIIDLFSKMAMEARGEMKAELIAPTALKPKEAVQVAERLSRAFGKKVNLETHQNKNLLGGVVVNVGSLQLDASLAGKLDRLAMALKAA